MSGTIARWTTPSIRYKPSQVGIGDIEEIFVTLKQKGVIKLVKGIEEASVTEDGILWTFRQDDTGLLDRGLHVEVQIDYMTTTKQRYTVMPRIFEPMDSAIDGVIT